MKSFLLCLIAVASFTLQGFAVPLPDGEVMIGVYYNSSSPSVENKTEVIFESDPVDAIYLAINGANSPQVTVNVTEVEKFDSSIPEKNIFNIPFLSQKTPLDPIEANETEIEALILEFNKKLLGPLKFPRSVEILNATDLKSNQTDSNDLEFIDYLNFFGNNTVVLVPFGNLTLDGSDSNRTDFNSSEIDDMFVEIINPTYLPTLFFNFTIDESSSNETDFGGLEMENIIIETINITSLPNFLFNLTADESDSNETEFNSSEIDSLANNVINSLNLTVWLANLKEKASKINETDLNSSEIGYMIGKAINATYLPNWFFNLIADELNRNETDFNSLEIDNMANNVIKIL